MGSAEERWRALEPHREKTVAIVRRIVGDYFDPEDCVHDAMVRVAQWAPLDLDRAGSTLLHAARQVAIDRFRRGNVAKRALSRVFSYARAETAAATLCPEQAVIDHDELCRALAVLPTLPARQREVMRLRLAGHTVAETAERLELSIGSVESAYSRARARFAETRPEAIVG